jgi:hypothetical protein
MGSQHPLPQLADPQLPPEPPPAPPPVPIVGPHTPALHTSAPVQAVQTSPMRPHWAEVGGSMQLVPLQQPAQVLELQVVLIWQAPATQLWLLRQATQVPPSMPQAPELVPIRQLPVLDTHPPQTNVSQVLLWHDLPLGHPTQVPPFLPQALLALPPRQMPPMSQQPAQVVGPQPPSPAKPPPVPPPEPPPLPPSRRPQALSTQAMFIGQEMQAAAPKPQANCSVPFWHMPFLSQHPSQLLTRQRGELEHAIASASVTRPTQQTNAFIVLSGGPFKPLCSRLCKYHLSSGSYKCASPSSIWTRRS